MKIQIELKGISSEEDSYALTQLAALLEQELEIVVEEKYKQNSQGIKDGGLVIALTIVGLAFSAVSTLITVLSYWDARQQEEQIRYSVSIVVGNKTFKLENLRPEQVETELASLNKSEYNVQVQILRK